MMYHCNPLVHTVVRAVESEQKLGTVHERDVLKFVRACGFANVRRGLVMSAIATARRAGMITRAPLGNYRALDGAGEGAE